MKAATGLMALLLAASGASAGEVTVAVAANAAEAVEALAAEFEERTGHRVTVTVGSTGKLYAQILHGAPFDVFLAADQERPRLLVEQGLAVEDSLRTYAIGRLALWSADPTVELDVETLRAGAFRRLAIANPDLAPYGAAARETLRQLGLWESLRPRIVLGENVGQAFAMTASGNAELGLVALSSILSAGDSYSQELWEVPDHLHAPIRQDAVLLHRAQDNKPAHDFLLSLDSPSIRKTIQSLGFAIEEAPRPRNVDQPGEGLVEPEMSPQRSVGKRPPTSGNSAAKRAVQPRDSSQPGEGPEGSAHVRAGEPLPTTVVLAASRAHQPRYSSQPGEGPEGSSLGPVGKRRPTPVHRTTTNRSAADRSARQPPILRKSARVPRADPSGSSPGVWHRHPRESRVDPSGPSPGVWHRHPCVPRADPSGSSPGVRHSHRPIRAFAS